MNEAAQAEVREPVGTVIWQRLTASNSPWPLISVAFLAIVSHLPVLGNSFNFDDWRGLESSYLTHPHAIRMFFTGDIWRFVGMAGLTPYYRPVLLLVSYLLFRVVGWDPMAFHAFSVVLHALASVLVLITVRRLSANHAVGVVTALLFAVHPATSEVIAWAGANQEPICVLFVLFALLSYMRCVEARGASRVLLLLVLGLSTLLAELTKEIGVFIPVFVVSYELLVQRRGATRQLRERWREYGVIAFTTLVYFAARFAALGGLKVVNAAKGVAPATHVWTGISVFYRYVALVIWPVNLEALPAYPPNRGPWEPGVLAGFLCMAAIAGLCYWLYRRRRSEALAIPIYVLPLLPMLQIPYMANGIVLAERAAYLPTIGFCWLAASGLLAARKLISRECVATVLGIVLVAYSVRSALRMYEWRDECALCEQAVALNPDSAFVRLYLGEALLRHDRAMESIVNLKEGLRVKPFYTEIHNMLGRAHFRLRQPEMAVREYTIAADLAMQDHVPGSAARAWMNIGITYRSMDRLNDAEAAYRRALDLDSTFTGARNNLGFVLLLQGQIPEAIAQLEETIRQDPGLPPAYANLGLAYLDAGRLNDAQAVLATAEHMTPNSGEVQARIGQLELISGRHEEARRRFEQALKFEPNNPRALAGIAALRHQVSAE